MAKQTFAGWLLVVAVLFSMPLFSQNNKQMVPFPFDWEQVATGQVNLSDLLEKPAGRDGFITIKDGHFVKPDGSRFRIWGVNMTGGAAYPEKEVAAKTAEFLAAMGINAIRFHFLDSDWGGDRSIFRTDTNTTRVLNPVQLDKLDFFVAELKKQGIYSNFNLNVGRNFREGDEVPSYQYLGLAKGVTLFDDRIIELQKEYAMQLLTHRNPYTGNEYRNEPALAFIEIVNENSLVEAWFTNRLLGEHQSEKTSTWTDIPVHYGKELTDKYNRWLQKNLSPGQLQELRTELELKDGQQVPRLKPDEIEGASDLRFHSEARFIMETENAFYTGMYNYLKDRVKVNQLVAANSDHNHWKSGYALLSSTSKLDFVDGHVYWQHPDYLTDSVTGKSTFSIENTAMVNDPDFSTVAQLSRSAVQGKPYTISETNHPYPNEFAAEGILILGAYALLQDWDGIYFYTLEHGDPLEWKTKKPNYFDMLQDPVKMASLAAGAPMFHRADVKPAKTMVVRNYEENDLIEGIRRNLGPKPFFTPGFPLATPLVYQTRIGSFEGGENEFKTIDQHGHLVSETGELVWDTKDGNGIVSVSTPKTQALIGYTAKQEKVMASNLDVQLKNPFAAVTLTSLDGREIDRSEKMLLTVTASSILSGARWNDKRTSLTEWGEQPFTIEPVTGKVILTGLNNDITYTLTPLDEGGNPAGKKQQGKVQGNRVEFEVGKVPTVWYVVERK